MTQQVLFVSHLIICYPLKNFWKLCSTRDRDVVPSVKNAKWNATHVQFLDKLFHDSCIMMRSIESFLVGNVYGRLIEHVTAEVCSPSYNIPKEEPHDKKISQRWLGPPQSIVTSSILVVNRQTRYHFGVASFQLFDAHFKSLWNTLEEKISQKSHTASK